MKTIIAGSRDITSYDIIEAAIQESGFEITEVISGTARGVDRLGERWAELHNIPIRRFPAMWGVYGKRAGFQRNIQMLRNADALVAVWDGKSKGTNHTIKCAKDFELKTFVKMISEPSDQSKPIV
jgi:hypothetical protein